MEHSAMEHSGNSKRWIERPWARAVAYTVAMSFVLMDVRVAVAAVADLSDSPLVTTPTATVRPNVLFVLDDSGSMGWNFLPDEMSGGEDTAMFKNHLCNKIYFNPSITYPPPKQVDSGGTVTDYPNANFYAAKPSGFSSSGSTVDLSTSFTAYNWESAQAAYYYQWTGTGTPTNSLCQGSSNFTGNGAAPTSTTDFNRVLVSAAQQQNFANWYSYYRTRMNAMKSAAGAAFAGLSDSYRVGFLTINAEGSGSSVSSSKYLKVDDFTATHKHSWFNKFYNQGSNNSTPLNRALSRAGRYFAGRTDYINSGMDGSPIQYECQRNYTILTSDGYWNSAPDGSTDTGFRLDGTTAIGQQDNVEVKPMWDGEATLRNITQDEQEYRLSSSGCTSGRRKLQSRTRTNTEEQIQAADGSWSTNGTSSSSWSSWNTVTSCSNPWPTLPTPNPQLVGTPATGTPFSGGGCVGCLADTAQYFYATDLRTDLANTLPPSGTGAEDDRAQHQHMTTFTLGFGISGTLQFAPDYKSGTGDFTNLRTGAKVWPAASAWGANGPKADDLWHAAVNGRGKAFSATDPLAIATGLTEVLTNVGKTVGSNAAATPSNLEPVAGDNFAYVASYVNGDWKGDLQARTIDLNTGALSNTAVWSAQSKLDAMVGQACDNRTIYVYRSGVTNNMVEFASDTYACDSSGLPTGTAKSTLNTSELTNFNATKGATLSQWPLMSAAQQTAAVGSNLVNFIRGQRGKENFYPGDAAKLYRARASVLGDLVGSAPHFVGKPDGAFADSGYASFKTAKAARTRMVYIAGNDGMLHAFYAGADASDPLGGKEAWAFIPTINLGEIYRTADNEYPVRHRFLNDGRPVVEDIYDGSNWRTVLIGGMNKGGRGYYALDITDPAAPKALWEFKNTPTSACFTAGLGGQYEDCDLGYSYSPAIVGKLGGSGANAGKWVAVVNSGYNNVGPGDGKGYVYVLDAANGEILYKVGTTVGSTTDPSNLGPLVGWITSQADKTIERVYGGDMQGNVWRFDINDTLGASGREAALLGVTKDAGGTRQPITTRVELAQNGSNAMVFVGTGRLLGASDLGNTQLQTMYGFVDSLTNGTVGSPVWTDFRTSLRQITFSTEIQAGLNVRTTTGGSCSGTCNAQNGWFIDLPVSKERINVEPRIVLGTLVFASNIPASSPCDFGGSSWVNFVDFRTGLQIPSSVLKAGYYAPGSLTVGITSMRLGGGSGSGRIVGVRTGSTNTHEAFDQPRPSSVSQGRRAAWREIGQ